MRCRTGRRGSPRTAWRWPISSGSPRASSAGRTGARRGRRRRRCTRTWAGRRWRGADPLGGRAPVHRGGLLPLRQVPLRRAPRRDARGARARGRLPERRAAVPGPAGRADRDPVRGQPAGRHPAAARRARAAPRRDDDPGPGLHQGGVPLAPRRCSSSAGWRPSPSTGPGQGEAEYDLPIRGDWEVPGQAIVDAVAAQPEHRRRSGSASGASASAATTRRVWPAASSRSGPASRSPARTTSASCWDQLPAADPDGVHRAFLQRRRRRPGARPPCSWT